MEHNNVAHAVTSLQRFHWQPCKVAGFGYTKLKFGDASEFGS